MVQKEIYESLAKEAQLQQKMEKLDSLTFKLSEVVRDAYRKRRASHKHVKNFKQLAHRRLKKSK